MAAGVGKAGLDAQPAALAQVGGIFRRLQALVDDARGPLFPLAFQKVLFFLPFQYATYVPAKVLLGSYELGGISMSLPQIVGCQALAVLCMWLVSEILWRLGVREYTGVGA